MSAAVEAGAAVAPIDLLLSRLGDRVRQVGPGRWRVPCSACGGTNPSKLSIGECSDGTVVIHCFGGCDPSAIVASLGLTLADLFAPSNWQKTGLHGARPRRPRVDWPAAIEACERDLILVKIVLTQLSRREPINDEDVAACQRAATRVYRLLQEARDG
jgi:hypothetical protein